MSGMMMVCKKKVFENQTERMILTEMFLVSHFEETSFLNKKNIKNQFLKALTYPSNLD